MTIHPFICEANFMISSPTKSPIPEQLAPPSTIGLSLAAWWRVNFFTLFQHSTHWHRAKQLWPCGYAHRHSLIHRHTTKSNNPPNNQNKEAAHTHNQTKKKNVFIQKTATKLNQSLFTLSSSLMCHLRQREGEWERATERQGDKYSTEDLTNCPQKGREMRHLFVVGATAGHYEKVLREKTEREPKNRLQPGEYWREMMGKGKNPSRRRAGSILERKEWCCCWSCQDSVISEAQIHHYLSCGMICGSTCMSCCWTICVWQGSL